MCDQPEIHFTPPPDPLGQLSARMLAQVDRDDVRGLLLLDDDTEKAMVVPFGQQMGTEHDAAGMLMEFADHMINLWHVFGMRLDLVVNGTLMPVHPLHESEGEFLMAGNGAERTVVSGFLAAVEARIAVLQADAQRALAAGEIEFASLKTAFATEFKALATEIQNTFQDL